MFIDAIFRLESGLGAVIWTCNRLFFEKWKIWFVLSLYGISETSAAQSHDFNVRNVIGTISYVTVIPATMNFYWPLTTGVGKPFRINRLSGNKEFNYFSKKDKMEMEMCCCAHVWTHYFALHEWNMSWAVITDFWQAWIFTCGNDNNLLHKQKSDFSCASVWWHFTF